MDDIGTGILHVFSESDISYSNFAYILSKVWLSQRYSSHNVETMAFNVRLETHLIILKETWYSYFVSILKAQAWLFLWIMSIYSLWRGAKLLIGVWIKLGIWQAEAEIEFPINSVMWSKEVAITTSQETWCRRQSLHGDKSSSLAAKDDLHVSSLRFWWSDWARTS